MGLLLFKAGRLLRNTVCHVSRRCKVATCHDLPEVYLWQHRSMTLPKQNLQCFHPWQSLLLQPAFVKNRRADPPPHWLRMGRSRSSPDLRLSIYKIHDLQVIGTYRLITACSFQNARPSTLTLTRSHFCKHVMWGCVIQIDQVVAWPSKLRPYYILGHNMQTDEKWICIK